MNQTDRDNPMVLDVKDFLARVEDDIELARELAELFTTDASAKIILLREAVAKGDADAIEKLAHSMKGASANLSANKVHDLAWQMERAGAAGTLSGVESLLGQLEVALKELEVMLKKNIIDAFG